MKISFFLLLALTAFPVMAADDGILVKNGDFQNNKQHWRGGGKIVIEKGSTNRVLELKSTDRAGDEISQIVNIGKAPTMKMTFRMKGLVYKGEGVRVKIEDSNGAYIFYTEQATEGLWTDFNITYNRENTEEKFTVIITSMPGKGSIQIDDVKISAGAKGDKTE